MKTALATILALGLLTGAASARTGFETLADTAPRSQIFADIDAAAPRSVFDDLQATAPRSAFEQLQQTAPRSDGVYGTLENVAP